MLGQKIGQYTVVRQIGRGGMGVVYEAVHERLSLRAAVKVLFAAESTQPAPVERFLAEARAASAVHHSSLVRLFDFGQLPDSTLYMMMELLDGETLRERLRQEGGRLPVARVLPLARQMASALEAVHQAGIVHCDLKPSNVILVADPEAEGGERAKLLDFGIAAFLREMPSPEPRRRSAGTPRYMSPEQCAGGAVLDGRSDVYSLAILLFEMLTGNHPYELADPDHAALRHAHLHAQPRGLRELWPEAPPELERLLREMLSKDAARRPTMAEVARRLKTLRGDAQDAAAPSSPSPPLDATMSSDGAAATPFAGLLEGTLSDEALAKLPRLEEYQLLRSLGHGAMGRVYAARDTRLDRPVAIKFLLELHENAAARERFLIEARAIARLSHPNVVAVYRVGDLDGHPYLVSELVSGQSLEAQPKPLPTRRVLELAIGLARGLSAAHRCGVLHRDIKPANVMVAADGSVKLLDFGLAKLVDAGRTVRRPLHDDPDKKADAPLADSLALGQTLPAVEATSSTLPQGPGLTQGGALVGTPLFMAPELFAGQPATFQSDIFSMGVLLYELCAGHVPHQAATLAELQQLVSESSAPPLAAVASQTDPRLASVIDRCLHRDPAERYASAEELTQELEALQHAAPAPSQRRRAWSWALGAMAVATAAGALFANRIWHSRSAPAAIQGMVYFPEASFTMGSGAAQVAEWLAECRKSVTNCQTEAFESTQPERRVTLSPFYLDRTEVTNQEFVTWLNETTIDSTSSSRATWKSGELLIDLHPEWSGIEYANGRFSTRPGHDRKPVLLVSWRGAMLYCQSHGKSLPTEAQWEYAARGGGRFLYPWGNEPPRCDGVAMARRDGQACHDQGAALPDVGTMPMDRSPQGVLDLGGSLQEWLLDRFVAPYPDCGACKDPVVDGQNDTPMRSVRGGDYHSRPLFTLAAPRGRWKQDQGAKNLGFRCASSVHPL